METEWIELEVDASRMRALLTTPAAADVAGDARVPAVLLCMHAPGIDAFMQDIQQRLARVGCASVLPDLYHRQNAEDGAGILQRMARLRDAELFRDLTAAAAALRMAPGVAARRIAVLGFCMGGRIAFLQAAKDASLNAAVCFYPGSIDVAWDGEAAEPEPDAATPLALGRRMTAPVLGIFGAEDGNPSPQHMAAIEAVLIEAECVHDMRAYPACGHAFLNFERPSYRAEAAADAWAQCIDWLQRYNHGP